MTGYLTNRQALILSLLGAALMVVGLAVGTPHEANTRPGVEQAVGDER